METAGASRSGSAPEASGEATAAARALLKALQRALVASRMYTLEHPAAQQALTEGAATWAEAGGVRVAVSIALASGRFVVGEESIAFAEGLEDLGAMLTRYGLAGLSVTPGGTLGTFRSVVEALAGHRADEVDASLLAGGVSRSTGGLVTLIPLNVTGVQIEDRERRGGEAGRVRPGDLTGLVRLLLRPASERTGSETAMSLAEAANEWDEDEERAPALVNHAQIATALASASPSAREEMAQSIGNFVAALKPSLGSAFLRFHPGDPGASMFLYRRLASSLPIEQLVASMLGTGDGGRPPTVESLRMMEKFVRIAERDSAESMALSGVVARISEGGVVSSRWASEVGSAMGEILKSRQGNTYTPTAYGAALDAFTRGRAASAGPLEEGRRLEWEAGALRAAEVAASLVCDPEQGTEDRESLLRPVADALPLLAREGKWEAIAGVGSYARGVVGAGAASARRLLDALKSADYISPLIEAMMRSEGGVEEWIEAFRPTGAVGVVELLARVGDDARDRRRILAARLVAESGVDRALVGRLAFERGSPADKALVGMCPGLIAGHALEILRPLLEHQRGEVRVSAAEALASLGHPWPEEAMERALEDSEGAVRMAGLRAIARGSYPSMAPALGSLLERGHEARTLTQETAAAVEALLACGQGGVKELGWVVRKLVGKPLPSRLAHARRLRWCAARLGAGPALNARVGVPTRIALVAARVVFYNDPRFFGG